MTERKRQISASERFLVISRDNSTCLLCGRSPLEDSIKIEVDHIFPFSKGGGSVFENVVCLCKECNSGKSDRVYSPEFEKKILEIIKKRNESLPDIKKRLEKDLRGSKEKKRTIVSKTNKSVPNTQESLLPLEVTKARKELTVKIESFSDISISDCMRTYSPIGFLFIEMFVVNIKDSFIDNSKEVDCIIGNGEMVSSTLSYSEVCEFCESAGFTIKEITDELFSLSVIKIEGVMTNMIRTVIISGNKDGNIEIKFWSHLYRKMQESIKMVSELIDYNTMIKIKEG